ncbi:MAG TPA: PEGA domain-containing protein, partial [Sulfurimonas sp.]|nr:PEGA domain-containing protein [Sulfurimonas sp.]
KSDIKLNGVKIVGKFSEKKYGKINLITYVAYNFGFKFEEQETLGESVAESARSEISSSPTTLTGKTIKPLARSAYNIFVKSKPSGATVTISGRKLGVTPLKTYIEPGMYSLAVAKEGYNTHMDVIETTSAEVTQLNLTLQQIAGKQVAGFKPRKNRTLLIAGVAILGGGAAYLLLNGDSEPKTGSMSIVIKVP